jgi:hypothetical protein
MGLLRKSEYTSYQTFRMGNQQPILRGVDNGNNSAINIDLGGIRLRGVSLICIELFVKSV